MNLAYQLPLETTEAPILQRVTEVVLPQAPGVGEQLLLPMLEHLSRQQPKRWLTWVGQCELARDAFRAYDLTTDCLRKVGTISDEQVLSYALQAMAAGTSQTVVAALSRPASPQQLQALEQAAEQGKCFGIILRRWG